MRHFKSAMRGVPVVEKSLGKQGCIPYGSKKKENDHLLESVLKMGQYAKNENENAFKTETLREYLKN